MLNKEQTNWSYLINKYQLYLILLPDTLIVQNKIKSFKIKSILLTQKEKYFYFSVEILFQLYDTLFG